MAATSLTLYLLLLAMGSIPAMQRWSARQLSAWLTQKVQAKVEIENLRLGLLNRIVIDGICIHDQNDSLMLDIARIAAKIELLPLAHQAIRIENAQLFGAHARLYRETAGAKPNCQFLLDAFSSNDTTSTPIDLKLGKLLVRGMSVQYDVEDQAETPGKLNPNHLHLKELRLNAIIHHLTPDSIKVELEKLAFEEKSGLRLEQMDMEASLTTQETSIQQLWIKMPHSTLSVPRLQCTYDALPRKGHIRQWLARMGCEGQMEASLSPGDIGSIVPRLQHFTDSIQASLTFAGAEGKVKVNDLHIQDQGKNILLWMDGWVQADTAAGWQASGNIRQMEAGEHLLSWLKRNLQGQETEETAILRRIGRIAASGPLHYAHNTLNTDIELHTQIGTAHVRSTLHQMQDLDAHVEVDRLEANRLLADDGHAPLEDVSASIHLTGRLKGEDGKPQWRMAGTLGQLVFKHYPYHNIQVSASQEKSILQATVNHEDINGKLNLDFTLSQATPDKELQCLLELEDVNLQALNLAPKMEDERMSLHIETRLKGQSANLLQGTLQCKGLKLESEALGIHQPGDLTMDLRLGSQRKEIDIVSPFLNANVRGTFEWQHLYPGIRRMVHAHLPELVGTDSQGPYNEEMTLQLTLQDTMLLRRLAGIHLKTPLPTRLNARLNTALSILEVEAESPEILYGGETLKNIRLHIDNKPEMMQQQLTLQRIIKQRPIEVTMENFAGYNRLRSVLKWDNKRQPAQTGTLDVAATFMRDEAGQTMVQASMSPTQITISDTLWNVHPATIIHRKGATSIQQAGISQGKRHLMVNGIVSKREDDSISVNLNDINLDYIFQMINFKALEFTGSATGLIYAKNLLEAPVADAFLHVKDFCINQGLMGEMDVHAGWGNRGKSIQLEADMRDSKARHHTQLQGTITPGHDPGSGLDLHIHTKRINLFFLNKFTSSIFTNLQGRATGYARVFGPFKQIDLEGDLIAEEASMKVNMLGTSYRLYGDSVVLRPGNIWIKNATAYDNFGSKGDKEHCALVDGHLAHNHLSNLRYDFSIQAKNVLAYDFHDFGDQSFYGTFFADGNVHLSGQPGELTVDVNAKPLSGSILTYNVGSPETLTEASFITYTQPADSLHTGTGGQAQDREEEEANDIHLNMDLDITPDASIKLLMDRKSGDHILLGGYGRIRAHYYNKGKFQMYGVYRVDNGIYKLSLQDFIRKDFLFREGGSITFGGDAYQATLNLQAIYTVPNVSLDDLSTSSLGLSNTRVDCVMNIGGKPAAPSVTFDFDLPNANEEERQMVRSIVSTEEEKNMQAMYLLGIGRFYNFDTQFASGSNQSSTAMNSLISSTLSSQFNQMMSQMVGNSNWTFGANLRTGETGWNELDVEGMLSGKLLDNRLQLNGNFGYRESVYSNNNFIGDFDVKYLITPGGTVALKVYNETNDRYFIQSSLTTQGIGIQLKKDFNRWADIFRKMPAAATGSSPGKRKKRSK